MGYPNWWYDMPMAMYSFFDEYDLSNKTIIRPELANHIANLDDYDTIFVGYPNWWYDMPMAMYSFFDEYDLSNKTIIPFNTSDMHPKYWTY